MSEVAPWKGEDREQVVGKRGGERIVDKCWARSFVDIVRE
jgi:hypothetical protein